MQPHTDNLNHSFVAEKRHCKFTMSPLHPFIFNDADAFIILCCIQDKDSFLNLHHFLF